MKHMATDRSGPIGDADSTARWKRDEALLALAKAGDDNAYTELIQKAAPGALRAVRKISNAEGDAEDALQEALLRSYTKLSTFNGRALFSTWFTRIAINQALMILRKRTRRDVFTVLTLLRMI